MFPSLGKTVDEIIENWVKEDKYLGNLEARCIGEYIVVLRDGNLVKLNPQTKTSVCTTSLMSNLEINYFKNDLANGIVQIVRISPRGIARRERYLWMEQPTEILHQATGQKLKGT